MHSIGFKDGSEKFYHISLHISLGLLFTQGLWTFQLLSHHKNNNGNFMYSNTNSLDRLRLCKWDYQFNLEELQFRTTRDSTEPTAGQEQSNWPCLILDGLYILKKEVLPFLLDSVMYFRVQSISHCFSDIFYVIIPPVFSAKGDVNGCLYSKHSCCNHHFFFYLGAAELQLWLQHWHIITF